MSKKTKEYEKDLLKRLKNSEYAADYLNAVLQDDEDGVEDRFLTALRDVAKAHGISGLSSETKSNRQNLYKVLSESGNPEFATLTTLLRALGLRLTIESEKKAS